MKAHPNLPRRKSERPKSSNQNPETAAKSTAGTDLTIGSTKKRFISPAERYKEQLKSLTPEQRNLQRLEWKWNRRKEKWIQAATVVQSAFRGYKGRQKIQKFKIHRKVILTTQNKIQEALSFVPYGKYDEALRLIQKAWALNPNYFETLKARAYIYFKIDNLHDCREDCNAFFVQHAIPDEFYPTPRPTDYDVFRLRGKVSMSLEDWDEAIQDFTEIIDNTGNDEEAYFLRGVAYFKMHEYVEAVVDMSQNIQMNRGEDALSYLHRGAIYSCMKKWEEALLDFSLALKLDPNAFTYVLRARVYTCMREWKRAERDYKRALDYEPEYEAAIEGLEQMHIEHNPLPLVL